MVSRCEAVVPKSKIFPAHLPAFVLLLCHLPSRDFKEAGRVPPLCQQRRCLQSHPLHRANVFSVPGGRHEVSPAFQRGVAYPFNTMESRRDD
jgi:hypothetical protein